MSDDYINRGIDSEHAVAHAYFDILDRMALMGRDLREIVIPPVLERPVEPTLVTKKLENTDRFDFDSESSEIFSRRQSKASVGGFLFIHTVLLSGGAKL
ncbi:hypothetical protein GCK32_020410 [Trichostrongylus colubriformis]|uniref:Uncharacterized protein n=1 Tax=Trichostrongylus colubriformis TaxID=6319 RepID=A0AAN8FKD0_TRICO